MRNKILILPLLFWAVLASAQNTGELPGVISVAEGRQVQFSRGNLQYQPATVRPYKSWLQKYVLF